MGNFSLCLRGSRKQNKSNLVTQLELVSTDFRPPAEKSPSCHSFLAVSRSTSAIFKSQFNWSKVQSVYLGCESLTSEDLKLTLPMLRTVEKLFDFIEENMLSNCKRIYFCVTLLGKKFESNFKDCMNDFHIISYEEKLFAHVISVVRLHRFILYALENDVNDAKDILNLIAVSHGNMNINATDFKLMDVAIEKYILKFSTLDTDTCKVVITYFTLLTSYICKCLNRYKKCDVSNMLLHEADDERTENMYQLRKWNRLVDRLRLDTAPYIEEFLRKTRPDVSLGKSNSFEFEKKCPLGEIKDYFTY